MVLARVLIRFFVALCSSLLGAYACQNTGTIMNDGIWIHMCQENVNRVNYLLILSEHILFSTRY